MEIAEPLRKMVTWETSDGNPIKVGDKTITPYSQALLVRIPYGGFVWNRPVALRVEQDGLVEEIPIVDVTRQAQLALTAGAFAAILIFRLIGRVIGRDNA